MLKLGILRCAAAAMVSLQDALRMVTASYDLDLFRDDKEMETLLEVLKKVEVQSIEDYRLAFVTSNEVDVDSVEEFVQVHKMGKFRELIQRFAEDVTPDGAFEERKAKPLKKRSVPLVNIGGRLVHRRLEDYQSSPSAPQPKPAAISIPLSSAAVRLRDSALRSQAKLTQKLALGQQVDHHSHLGAKTTLHEREESMRSRAIDSGYMVLREVGSQSPRYGELFDSSGNIAAEKSVLDAFNDIIMHGNEPPVVLNYAAESVRFLSWVKAVGLPLESMTDLRVAGFIHNSRDRGKLCPEGCGIPWSGCSGFLPLFLELRRWRSREWFGALRNPFLKKNRTLRL